MSRILEATCEDGVVSVAGVAIDGVEVLTAGLGQSNGVLIIDAEKAYYFATSAGDLDSTITLLMDAIDSVTDAVTKVSETLTAIGTGMTGPTTAPPAALPTNVTFINDKVTELIQIKSNLDNLKGELS